MLRLDKSIQKNALEISNYSMPLEYFYFAYIPLFLQDIKGLLHLKHSRTQY